MHRVRNAFTLIELLVVIAIIAILAAILFPVFAQARESARTSSCLSNTKQISLGVLQYVQDYDEHWPLWLYTDAAGNVVTSGPGTPDAPWGIWHNNHIGWDKTTQPYIKNIQVFQCPSNDIGDSGQRTAGVDDSAATGAVHYALNGHLSHRDNGVGTNMSSVRFPAITIMLAESSRGSSTGETTADLQWMEWGYNGGHMHQLNGDGNLNSTWDANDNGNQVNALCKTGSHSQWGQSDRLRAHKGGANYAFVDGHSKWYQGDATCVVWSRTTNGGIPQNESGSTITYIP